MTTSATQVTNHLIFYAVCITGACLAILVYCVMCVGVDFIAWLDRRKR